MYTPFDLYVEQVYRNGVVNESSVTASSQKKQAKLQKQLNQQNQPQPAAEYAFHRRYVVDLPNLGVRGTTAVPRASDKIVQRHVTQRFPLVNENPNRIEIRSRSDEHNAPSYAVPAIDKQRLGTPRHAMVLMTVRELFLTAVESLMDLEQLDRVRREQRQQQQ